MNEWATAPLLDKSNVGKDVWTIWNSNHSMARREMILKITRTNIHTPSGSYRIDDGGQFGHGMKNGYGIACETDVWRSERDERTRLSRALREFHWYSLPLPVLNDVAALAGLTGPKP